MSSPFETSPARAYFKELERWFIELRGAPLQLSPDDYRMAKEWFGKGIPLELVREEIRDSVDRQKEKGGEVKRRLRYYGRAVERSFEQRRFLQAPGDSAAPAPLDVDSRLRSLAAALPVASWCEGFAARVSALQGEAGQVEERLTELESELLSRGREALDGKQEAHFRDLLDESLERLGRSLPGGAGAAVRERLERQILRRILTLPEMSLFGLDAGAGADHADGDAS